MFGGVVCEEGRDVCRKPSAEAGWLDRGGFEVNGVRGRVMIVGSWLRMWIWIRSCRIDCPGMPVGVGGFDGVSGMLRSV